MSEPNERVWNLVRVEPETEDTTTLVLEAGCDTECLRMAGRRPGQFASIRVMGGEGWSEPHPFTISCGLADKQLRFTIKSKGEFTSSLRGLAAGTKIRCDGPFGTFCEDVDQHEQVVLIAGGVGITPFLSVLRSFRARALDHIPCSIVLFWANRTLDDAFAADELEAMTRDLPLTVVHVLSRQPLPEAPAGSVQYESGHLKADMVRSRAGGEDTAYYLCGPPAMQKHVLEELAAIGVDKEAVDREAFGKS